MGWTPADIGDLTGRRAVVTGANAGLGLEIARELAAHGREVVLACRSTARGEAAARRIGGRTSVRALDLADLDSVAAFADGFTGRLDLLVDNAGLMAVDAGRTRRASRRSSASTTSGTSR
jgi:NAD(P)-dependent dehydrogenase (short-subunit alcohol dehydrogenase family)